MPTSGGSATRAARVISLSAQSVSPTNTGFGSLMSVHPRLATAFSLVSANRQADDERERERAVRRAARRTRVRSAYASLKCIWFVFSVRHVNQVLSVSVIVRPRRLRYDVADVEVLVEPAAPLLRRGRLPAPLASTVAPFRFADSSRPLDDGQVDDLAVESTTPPRPRRPCSYAATIRGAPLELIVARREDAVHAAHLAGVNAELAAEAERAGEPASPSSPSRRARRRGRRSAPGFRPPPSRSRASSARRGAPARPVGLEAELDAEVDGAERRAPRHAGCAAIS